jgi:Tfp pilus assembly protein PilN
VIADEEGFEQGTEMKEHINLFQPDILEGRVRGEVSAQKLLFPVSLFLLIFLFAGFHIQDGKKQIMLQKEVENIIQQRDQLRQQIESLTGVPVSEGLQSVGILDDPELREKIVWSRLLQQVSLVVPEGVWITQFENATGQTVQFSGFGSSHQKVTELIASLEASRYFQDVLLEFSRQNAGEKKVDFSIHTRLRKEAFERPERG